MDLRFKVGSIPGVLPFLISRASIDPVGSVADSCGGLLRELDVDFIVPGAGLWSIAGSPQVGLVSMVSSPVVYPGDFRARRQRN